MSGTPANNMIFSYALKPIPEPEPEFAGRHERLHSITQLDGVPQWGGTRCLGKFLAG